MKMRVFEESTGLETNLAIHFVNLDATTADPLFGAVMHDFSHVEVTSARHRAMKKAQFFEKFLEIVIGKAEFLVEIS
jgi:hypothetical protein